MKYIKSHKLFENTEHEYDRLYQDIIDAADYVEKKYKEESISFGNDLANNDKHIKPKKLIKEMDKYLSNKGWERNDIHRIVNSFKDDMSETDITKMNGYIDTYLYSILPDYFPLGGSFDIEKDIDESYIQYSYGWHRNEYGMMYILQNFDSIEDYRETTIARFIELMYGKGRGDFIPIIPSYFATIDDDYFENILMDSLSRTKDTLSFHKEQILESGVPEDVMENYWDKLYHYQPVTDSSTLDMRNTKDKFIVHFWL